MSDRDERSPIEQAAIDLHAARTARDAAKKALRAFREVHGACELADDGVSMHRHPPCYDMQGGGTHPDDWCEVCTDSQPLYLERKAAGILVGVTMRKLMNLCGKQSEYLQGRG